MATQTNSGDSASSDSAVGDVAWSNPSFALTNDTFQASSGLTVGGTDQTEYLKILDFDFSLGGFPATVNGVEVNIWKFKDTGPADVADTIVSLVVGGVVTGDNKAAGGNWSSSEAQSTYGGAADLWGLSLTQAQVEATNFGVVISATASGLMIATAKVDYVEITVTYTPGFDVWVTWGSGDLSIGSGGMPPAKAKMSRTFKAAPYGQQNPARN